MSDPDWGSWQTLGAVGDGPLPGLRARAQAEARLHRLANFAFLTLIAIALAGAG